MPDMPAWVDPNDRMIWAPSVVLVGATYTMYFAASSAGSGTKCLGAAVSATPGGPFAPQPDPLHCLSRYWSIDPYAVADGLGGWFLLWRQDSAEVPAGSAVAAPLTPDGLGLAGGEQTLLVGELPWEDGSADEPGIGPIENPAMARDPDTGEWLLTWSANRWDTQDYATGLATCTRPLGPCARLSRDKPWLHTSEDSAVDTSAEFGGAGGLCFVTGPDHQLYAVFHAYRGTDTAAESHRIGWAYKVVAFGGSYELVEF
jgi:hypothetical protein